jgi:hypothetical protein
VLDYNTTSLFILQAFFAKKLYFFSGPDCRPIFFRLPLPVKQPERTGQRAFFRLCACGRPGDASAAATCIPGFFTAVWFPGRGWEKYFWKSDFPHSFF